MKRGLYTFFYSLVLGISFVATPFSKKLRRFFVGRFQLKYRLRKIRYSSDQSPLWFHVASSGEFEQCLPILEEIKRRNPTLPIHLSYFSPSAELALSLERKRRELSKLKIPWDSDSFSPWDFPWSVRHYLRSLKPQSFVSIHREVWLNLLHECHRQKIPCHLYGAYFSASSRKKFYLYRRAMEFFSSVGAVDANTTSFLKAQLHNPTVRTLGDPRVERVLSRKQMGTHSKWLPFFTNQSVLILGSLWPADFEALQDTLNELSKRSWRFIAAPHQPDERFLSKIESWFHLNQLKLKRWSQWKNKPETTSHILVDTVGELAELYQLSTLAFVGGSFKKKVHNVLEPAAYKKPIFTGPFIQNSGEASFLAEQPFALTSVKHPSELWSQVDFFLSESNHTEKAKDAIGAFLEGHKGSAIRYADNILS